jgi:hypothetical protein
MNNVKWWALIMIMLAVALLLIAALDNPTPIFR